MPPVIHGLYYLLDFRGPKSTTAAQKQTNRGEFLVLEISFPKKDPSEPLRFQINPCGSSIEVPDEEIFLPDLEYFHLALLLPVGWFRKNPLSTGLLYNNNKIPD